MNYFDTFWIKNKDVNFDSKYPIRSNMQLFKRKSLILYDFSLEK